MTTETTLPNSHIHFFNHHTGRPRFHFEEGAAGAGAAAAGAGAGAGAAGGAAGAGAGAATAWHTGVEPEILGFWQNKGLPLDDPKAFGVKLTEFYRNAEKLIGGPSDQLVKLPKADAKPEDLRAFYERLGAPKEAKDYDFSAIKDTAIADALRATAFDRGLSKDAANAVATAVAKAFESKATTDGTVTAQKLADQKAALKQDWGDKFDFNHLQAMEGARRSGVAPEAVKAMEEMIGYDKVMEHFRKIGANTREGDFVGGGPPGTGEVTTREGAMARKAELMADPAWGQRYVAGGQAEAREMTRLNSMIDGVAA